MTSDNSESIDPQRWRSAMVAAKTFLQEQNEDAESDRLRQDSQDSLSELLRVGALTVRERVEAGNLLAKLGDPRFRSDAFHLPDDPRLGFVEIPEGPFFMGEGDERHELTLPTYYLGRYHVTVAQFRAYVEEADLQPPTAETLSAPDNHPVVWVSWYEARAYCDWLSEKLAGSEHAFVEGDPFWTGLRDGSLVVSLPSEAEWEKAARGRDGNTYPWGDAIDPERANYKDTEIGTTCPVGCFPAGRSPYGVYDMSGNAWNWLRSAMGRDLEKMEFGYPYDPSDGREDPDADSEVLRGMRGGAFTVEPERARCTFRDGVPPNGRDDADGFRLVVVEKERLTKG